MKPTPNDKPPHTELVALNLKEGNAVFVLEDKDENWTEYKACFLSNIFYKDTSFDHAFGTHTQGEWQLEIGEISLSAIDYEGKMLPCDKQTLLETIHQSFDDDHELYIPAPYEDDYFYDYMERVL